MKSLYVCKCEYLYDHGFEGHIKDVNYWYRKVFNIHRGRGARARYNEQRTNSKGLGRI